MPTTAGQHPLAPQRRQRLHRPGRQQDAGQGNTTLADRGGFGVVSQLQGFSNSRLLIRRKRLQQRGRQARPFRCGRRELQFHPPDRAATFIRAAAEAFTNPAVLPMQRHGRKDGERTLANQSALTST